MTAPRAVANTWSATWAAGVVVALCVCPVAGAETIYVAGTRMPGQPSAVSIDEARVMTGDDEPVIVDYPRDMAPMIGRDTLDASVRQGESALARMDDPDTPTTVVGVSQGAVVTQQYAKALAATRPDARIQFVTYGDPTNTDGGLLGRMPAVIPGITPVRADPSTPFETTTYALEYDLIADAPDRPNPVSWANAVMGAFYFHPTYDHDTGKRPGDETVETTDGNVTHVLVKARELPLTKPLRDLGIDTSRIDRPLKKIVDAGYTGVRTNPVDVTGGNKVTPKRVKPVGAESRSPRLAGRPKASPDHEVHREGNGHAFHRRHPPAKGEAGQQ